MGAAADRQLQPLVLSEANCLGDVLRSRTTRDERRMVVDVGVPHPSRLVVGRVSSGAITSPVMAALSPPRPLIVYVMIPSIHTWRSK
jgi:hypothetical protein